MKWFADNWFKIALLLVVPLTALILVYGLVIYPENIRQEEKSQLAFQEEMSKLEEERKEQERVDNLQSCLDESETRETYAHLALCGDPNVGRSPASCTRVFGGASSYIEVVNAYENEFPGELPEVSIEDFSTWEERSEILDAFFDKCNCGLERTRRDELKEDKESRDDQCFAFYGA